MSRNIPCKKCIVFAICKAKRYELAHIDVSVWLALYYHCRIFKKYYERVLRVRQIGAIRKVEEKIEALFMEDI